MAIADRDTVEVKIDFRKFGVGKSANSSSALIRPFRLLLDEGKPIGTINYLFYLIDRARVLGALCFTPGKRLLFFPGLAARIPRWFTKGTVQESVSRGDQLLDHLSLEPDFNSFHATALGPNSTRDVLTSYKTTEILSNVTYWFGFSIRTESVLEDCPEEIAFQFSSPPRDSSRRVQIVLSSREGAKFHIISLNPDAKIDAPSFIHFDFIVDRRHGLTAWLSKNFPKRRSMLDLASAPTTAPNGPPALKHSVSVPPGVPVRSHPVTMPGFHGIIWVVSSSRIGELVEPAVIGGF